MTKDDLKEIAESVRELALKVRALSGGDGYVDFSCMVDGGVHVAVHGVPKDTEFSIFVPDYANFAGRSNETMERAHLSNLETARLIEIGRQHA